VKNRALLFVAWAAVCSCGHDRAGDGSSSGASTPGVSATAGASGLLLRGGSIVDPSHQTITVGDLAICGGVVVDSAGAQGCSLTQVDVTGKWIIPSLHDMHVHARGISLGNGGFQPIAIEDEASLFRVAGVTSFLDAMNDEAKIFPARDVQRSQALVQGADIFCSGGAFTPTGGHGTEYGLPATSYRIVDTVQEVVTQMADLGTKNPDVVKIMYDHRGIDGGPDVADGQQGELGIAMSQPVMQALVSTANANHRKTEVHIGVWNDARSAIEAGATLIAHLGEPAIPADIVQLAKQNGVYWMPTQSLYHGLTDIIADQSLLDDPLLQQVASVADIDTYRASQLNVDPYTMAW
jgi:imidazolonepropionase-like amidohydrolase